jgi:hypothetical protein
MPFPTHGYAATVELLRASQFACSRSAALLSATRARIACNSRRIHPAWGLRGASDDPVTMPARRRGVMFGALRAKYPGHVTIGDVDLFLTDGVQCPHPLGLRLEVHYTVLEDGRRVVERIAPASSAR